MITEGTRVGRIFQCAVHIWSTFGSEGFVYELPYWAAVWPPNAWKSSLNLLNFLVFPSSWQAKGSMCSFFLASPRYARRLRHPCPNNFSLCMKNFAVRVIQFCNLSLPLLFFTSELTPSSFSATERLVREMEVWLVHQSSRSFQNFWVGGQLIIKWFIVSSLPQKEHVGLSRSFTLCKYLLHVISLCRIRYWKECIFVSLVVA